MYNFKFEDGETLVEVFDPIYIKQGDIERNIAVALTTQRILFLAFLKDNPLEDMKSGNVIGVINFKQVFYEIPLANVQSVQENDIYKVTMFNGTTFEFENEGLYKLLLKNIKG